MFAKLCTIILALGATGLALLLVRQQRIDAAHEMGVIHGRIRHHEENLWRLQDQIAARISPDELRQLIERLNLALAPIGAPRDLNESGDAASTRLAAEHEPSRPRRTDIGG